jgi:hypothetical protein
MRQEDVELVGLKQKIKQNFLLAELQGLSRYKFAWNWLPASGHLGGILLGVKAETFKVEDMDRGEFFLSVSLTHRRSNLQWEVIIVYGPTDHRRSLAFLTELKAKVEHTIIPVVVAGDFNLIRTPEDKSCNIPRFYQILGEFFCFCFV